MLQQHSERAHDRGHCRLQGNYANEPWQFLDMLGTARAWDQQVECCGANALDFVEPHMDYRETKEMLSEKFDQFQI